MRTAYLVVLSFAWMVVPGYLLWVVVIASAVFTPKQDGSHQEACAVGLTPVSSRKMPAVAAACRPWLDKDGTGK